MYDFVRNIRPALFIRGVLQEGKEESLVAGVGIELYDGDSAGSGTLREGDEGRHPVRATVGRLGEVQSKRVGE